MRPGTRGAAVGEEGPRGVALLLPGGQSRGPRRLAAKGGGGWLGQEFVLSVISYAFQVTAWKCQVTS